MNCIYCVFCITVMPVLYSAFGACWWEVHVHIVTGAQQATDQWVLDSSCSAVVVAILDQRYMVFTAFGQQKYLVAFVTIQDLVPSTDLICGIA